ncbi:MAG: hypothetical protein KGP28_12930 [Bdellovibrionales bacterium]|nr:hypothetical protein [Bdellovibrionales bacterium]
MAFKDAAAKAGPLILEPLMKCEVVYPGDCMGSVIGDLNARGGKIHGMNARCELQIIDAEVPLSRMFGYSTALRSSFQGRATFSMQFSHYSPVSATSAGGDQASGRDFASKSGFGISFYGRGHVSFLTQASDLQDKKNRYDHG